MMQTERIGWIGPGSMGEPMASRLQAAGYSLTICGSGRRDLSPLAARMGAALAPSVQELASQTDIFFTMIPNGEILLSIAGQLAGLDMRGKLWVDMSTVDPASSAAAAAKMEALGGHFLRAPVTGSTHYAKEGTLGILVSGLEEDFSRALPLLQILGNRQTYLGGAEEARQMKILINMLLAQELQALSEALTVGKKLGLPWDSMLELIADSAAGAPIYKYKCSTLKALDFNPTSTGYNMHKDMKMAMELAASVNASVPTAAITMQMYNALMSMGLSRLDNTAVYLVNERMNGTQPGETAE